MARLFLCHVVRDVSYIDLEKESFIAANKLFQWFANNGFKLNIAKP